MGAAASVWAIAIVVIAGIIILPCSLRQETVIESPVVTTPEIPVAGPLENESHPSRNCSVRGVEGSPIVLDASCALGPPSNDVRHRWDLNADNTWDTPWLTSDEYEHVWGDDYNGSVHVARGTPKEQIDIALEADLHQDGVIGWTDWIAQSFVPSKPLLTKVAVWVSINWGEPSDLHAWIRDTLDISGTNLSHGSIPYTEVPRSKYIKPDEWPVIDMDDVVLQTNRTYYLMLNMLSPSPGVYEGHGVGDIRPEWPLYGGNFALGWVTDPDDDMGFRTYTEDVTPIGEGDINVTVMNIAPTPKMDVGAYGEGEMLLRVAGEKWHDVTAIVYRNGVEEYAGRVVRTPGSPNDQAVALGNVTIDVASSDVWSARVAYTPPDDPINGQPNGANPAWLIFRSEYGSESTLHHTFNVRHNDTWVWDLPDLRELLTGMPLDFKATATDPGSDDLTFAWYWGDGTTPTATTYFNDGIGPDSYPSPGGTFPFTAADACAHIYNATGTFTVILRLSDDDGGVSETALTVNLS